MNTKIMVVSAAKVSGSKKKRPKIRLAGAWLAQIGFEYNRLVTVDMEDGNMVFKAHEQGTTYLTVGKVLNSKLGVLQVRRTVLKGKEAPAFEVKGAWVEKLGFTIGSIVSVHYEYGTIRMRVVDIEKLSKDSKISL